MTKLQIHWTENILLDPLLDISLPPRSHEIGETNLILKSLPPNEVEVNSIFDDYRPRSNLATNKTVTKNLFLGPY